MGSNSFQPLARLAWFDAPLTIQLPTQELAAAQRYCVHKTRASPTDTTIASVQVLCTYQEEANAAVETIRIAALDARERVEIQQRQGHLVTDEIAAFLARATAR